MFQFYDGSQNTKIIVKSFTKSDKYIFDMGLEYGMGKYSPINDSDNFIRQRVMLNIHIVKKLFFTPTISYGFEKKEYSSNLTHEMFPIY